MQANEVYIAHVSWGDGGKRRPVLVLGCNANSVIAFNITTQYENKSDSIRSKYFPITEWRQAGLNNESYIDTNNTITLPLSAVEHQLGVLSDSDSKNLREFLSKKIG